MSTRRNCLICYSSITPLNELSENENKMKCQITAFFITKRLFEISDLTCTNLLKDHGNPSKWFVSCSECVTATQNAQVAFNQLMEIESKWKNLKSQFELQLLNNHSKQKSSTNSNSSEAIIREEICKRLENEMQGAKTDSGGQENNRSSNEKFYDIKIELKEEVEMVEDCEDRPDESTLFQRDGDILTEVFSESENDNTSNDELSSDCLQEDDKVADDMDLNSNTQNANGTTDHNISQTNIGDESTRKIIDSKTKPTPERKRHHILKKSTNKLALQDNMKPYDAVCTCLLCGKSFKGKYRLNRHRKRIHFPNDPKEKFPPKFKYSIQIDKSLPENENPTTTVQCRCCVKTLNSVIQQYEHENAVHGMKNQFVCSSCKNYFSTEAGLHIHFNKVHGSSGKHENRKSFKKFPCEHCGKIFLKDSNLKTHVDTVHKNLRNFVCESCPQSFTQLRNLKFHQMREHNVIFDDINLNELTCEHCGKIMADPGALRLHIKGIHEKDYKFRCSICNVGRFSQSAMNRHMKMTHSKEKPERCTMCIKSYANTQSLVRHMKTHNDERPYKCKHCDKSFFTPSKLNRHEVLHKGLVYNCDLCDKTFPSQHYLDNHRYNVHKLRKTDSSQKAFEKV